MPAFSLVHVLTDAAPDWTGERGTLDKALLDRRVPNWKESVFWISGPPQMVFALNNMLLQIHVKAESIRTDTFLGY